MEPGFVSAELRNLLWNIIYTSIDYSNYEHVTLLLWHTFYKKPIDTRPSKSGYDHISYAPAWEIVREKYFTCEWYEIFNYLEFFVANNLVKEKAFNHILSKELSAYRIIDGAVCPITDEMEIQEITSALETKGKFSSISEHLKSAISHLSSRENPDYRNSIKESICAVESICKILSGKEKAGLGDALSVLEKQGRVNAPLKQAFEKIWGWSSDTNGIRHAMIDDSNVDQADAKFYLIVCCAFINYLKAIK
jgi:hypothetical protein